MKKIITFLILTSMLTVSLSAQLKVLTTKGDVKVRYGVSEEWKQLKAGDQINLADAIRTSSKSSAVIQIDNQKKIALNEKIIVEMADLRYLSQEELLLKLAMERILSVPPQDRDNDLIPARTTIIHGEKKSKVQLPIPNDIAMMQLNGAKLLYDNNFYGTCAIRIKEVLRLNQNLSDVVNYKLMTANSLEKSNLFEEALNEYASLPFDQLTSPQKQIVQQNIDRLKKKIAE
ncbi:MAG: hypothetical protein KJ963_01335 [Bacteroidetes bacterium]|nr:hypothetical protein [Bacteroidota bacterium]